MSQEKSSTFGLESLPRTSIYLSLLHEYCIDILFIARMFDQLSSCLAVCSNPDLLEAVTNVMHNTVQILAEVDPGKVK